MRTLLTYVLAAFVAALVPAIWFAAEAVIYGWFEGDPRVVAGAVSQGLVQVVIWMIALLVVGLPLWAVVERVFAARGKPPSGLSGIALGASVFGVFFLAVWLALFQTDWFAFDRSDGPSVVWEVVTAFGLLTVPGLVFWLGGAVMGAVWGTVFWIRAPKPTTAGIAA